MEEMRSALVEQDDTQEKMEKALEEKLLHIQELCSGERPPGGEQQERKSQKMTPAKRGFNSKEFNSFKSHSSYILFYRKSFPSGSLIMIP